LIGFDCSFHMAEEAKDASRVVPYALIIGYIVNVSVGFLALMICIYIIGPLPDALNNASTGYPVMNLVDDSTGHIGSAFFAAIIIICFMAGAIASLAAASRQLWAFARNGGVPFSRFFAPEHHLQYDIPLNAIFFSLAIPVIIALLNIASPNALGIILSIYNSALIASYAIVIFCTLLHRLRGRQLPKARYSLGKWGFLVNAIALIYISPIFVFSFFPSTPNPTAATMNWAIAMVGGITLFATIYYIFWGRRTYSPPTEYFIGLPETTTASSEGAEGDEYSGTKNAAKESVKEA